MVGFKALEPHAEGLAGLLVHLVILLVFKLLQGHWALLVVLLHHCVLAVHLQAVLYQDANRAVVVNPAKAEAEERRLELRVAGLSWTVFASNSLLVLGNDGVPAFAMQR